MRFFVEFNVLSVALKKLAVNMSSGIEKTWRGDEIIQGGEEGGINPTISFFQSCNCTVFLSEFIFSHQRENAHFLNVLQFRKPLASE